MSRLNAALLSGFKSDVITPTYDRAVIKPGIVHLGVGAFHRAHQAFYTEQVLNKFGGDWGIVGASMRSATVANQLNPQDGLYTLIEKSESSRFQVVGSIQRVITAPEQPQSLIDVIASPSIHVVTLTVTEKGYCHDPASGQLLADHAGIQSDLRNNLQAPSTAIGFLVAGLKQRFEQQLSGLTLLSCDNLPNNGHILQNVVMALAEKVSTDLAAWISTNVSFPCSMVDRIVPSTTVEDLVLAEQALDVQDLATVTCEPFTQWVIENKFATPMPQWGEVGALIVDDVRPFEDIKLRLLNGSHSIIAYLGFVAGYDYVHQVMGDKAFCQLIQHYMEAVTKILEVPAGFDIEHYQQQLLDRFTNPSLQHRTAQIAMDGSQKIPQRWLHSVVDMLQVEHSQNMKVLNAADEQPSEVLALAVAGWIKYLHGQRDNGDTFVIDDPMAEMLQAALDLANSEKTSPVLAIVSIKAIFGDLLQQQPDFVERVSNYFTLLKEQGNLNTIESALSKGRVQALEGSV